MRTDSTTGDASTSLASPRLSQRRAKAAELSQGISTDAIYARIEQLIAEKGLGGRILDYGAGIGHLTRRLLACQRFERVSAVDMRGAPGDLASVVEWIEQDLNVPLPGCDNAFDVVVATEVIEHLENPRLMIREIFRILRPGGTAIDHAQQRKLAIPARALAAGTPCGLHRFVLSGAHHGSSPQGLHAHFSGSTVSRSGVLLHRRGRHSRKTGRELATS
jgi:2-polyprenyl-3-methyl-5-hydroxy-6-metoxy-1,4-benzoquinol methylase